MLKTTIDSQEINKFEQHASHWWDKEGPLKTLHDINSTRMEFILNVCELQGKSVLDVGCGGGILSEAMAVRGATVTGLDVESEALKTAREHAKSSSLKINYVDCPIEEYKHKAFDIITCMEMLEHVKDPQVVIEHCNRLLKPGGHLFLSTINRTLKAYVSVVVAAEYILNLLPRQTHDFQKFIKPSELLEMCRTSQLEFLELKGMNYNPFTRIATIQESVSINYLVSLVKPSST